MKIDSNLRLRDSVHDIVVTNDSIHIDQVCENLAKYYKIYIQPEVLHIILDRWSRRKRTNIFFPDDVSWLKYDSKDMVLISTVQNKRIILGKSRRRQEEEEIEKEKERLKKLKEQEKKLAKQQKKVQPSQQPRKSYTNMKRVGDHWEMVPVYALSADVLFGTFENINPEQMEQIREKVLTSGIISTYAAYWEEMTKAGEELGLTYTKWYMKFSPQAMINRINKPS